LTVSLPFGFPFSLCGELLPFSFDDFIGNWPHVGGLAVLSWPVGIGKEFGANDDFLIVAENSDPNLLPSDLHDPDNVVANPKRFIKTSLKN
jgi:hypothetical protein